MSEDRSRILIIDDNPKNLDVLSDLFDQQDVIVLFALDGKSGLQRAMSGQPDLILLDVMMPGMDGFEVCHQLKTDTCTQEIPVVFMTALSETADKVRGFQAGAVDYITKPIQPEEVLARVKTHLSLRNLQKKLQHQNEQLRKANASKDTFFSILAHDLKSPLNSLKLFPELIIENIEEYSKEEILKYTSMQQQAVTIFSALLENLLTWSKNQKGLADYRPQTYKLQKIIERTITFLNPSAEQKQIQFIASVADDAIAYVDLNMIDTVLRNLLSNALKFSKPEGTVEISVVPRGSWNEILVRDRGIGIPVEAFSKLFRIDTSFKRVGTANEAGTGLGLIICKEFVERHGGTLRVESEVGKGSVFSFTVPKEPVQEIHSLKKF